MKQKLIHMQREIGKSAISVRDFNIPLQELISQVGMKISKATIDLNSTNNQFDLTDIYSSNNNSPQLFMEHLTRYIYTIFWAIKQVSIN